MVHGEDEHGLAISTLLWKCAARTENNLGKDREKALHNVYIGHQAMQRNTSIRIAPGGALLIYCRYTGGNM